MDILPKWKLVYIYILYCVIFIQLYKLIESDRNLSGSLGEQEIAAGTQAQKILQLWTHRVLGSCNFLPTNPECYMHSVHALIPCLASIFFHQVSLKEWRRDSSR